MRNALCLVAVAGLAGCNASATPEKTPALVKTETVGAAALAPTYVLTGEIAPPSETGLSFRSAGRIVARTAEVGDHVVPGQVLARLDPAEQEANVASAEASVAAAKASLTQAAAAFERQRDLLDRGFTTRRDYDKAEESLRRAKASLDAALAQLATARDQLTYTTLTATTAGVVTARSGEVGEVVQAAQTIFTIAADGPRDAIFRLPESAFAEAPADRTLTITLVSDPAVRAVGTVREVAPSVDGAGTVTVKVGLEAAPEAMTLGAAVEGTVHLPGRAGIAVPHLALTSKGGQPAVWIVDPATAVVSLRQVAVARYATGTVILSGGLEAGDTVVVAGAQLLRPGQRVEPIDGETE